MSSLFEHPAVTRAKHIWAEREKGFPRFVRQTWEQGTQQAREATVALALAEIKRARDSDGSPKGGDGEAGSVRSTTARAEGIAHPIGKDHP